ncbi:MAG: efflux RND transporter periplasmic adaptor subunit, partial [Burkholderiaceae bacterium]
MASKLVYSAVAVVGIAVASGAAWWFQNKPRSQAAAGTAAGAPAQGASAAAGQKPTVEVARAETMRMLDETQAVGDLKSRQSVVLRPEVSGRVTQINFRDGARVSRGQLLVQLDDQLPLAQVAQSQAELSIAQANHKRNQELVAENFISQRSLDESAAALQVAQAKLSLSRATAARLKIMAPFSGIAGISAINVGDYLKDGGDIVNIEEIDALFVDFRLPERVQPKLQRGQRAMVEVEALPGRRFNAVVQAIDPLVDANGRSIAVRGCIDNRQLQLRPGMFARVNMVFAERENAVVIPEEAIVPQGNRQFVIKLAGEQGVERTTQRAEVKVGARRAGRVEILSGVQAGETVVTAGQQKVQRDGTAVRVVDMPRAGAAGQPPAAPAPAANGQPAAAAPAAPAAPAV